MPPPLCVEGWSPPGGNDPLPGRTRSVAIRIDCAVTTTARGSAGVTSTGSPAEATRLRDLRRALDATSPEVETIGFPGFFACRSNTFPSISATAPRGAPCCSHRSSGFGRNSAIPHPMRSKGRLGGNGSAIRGTPSRHLRSPASHFSRRSSGWLFARSSSAMRSPPLVKIPRASKRAVRGWRQPKGTWPAAALQVRIAIQRLDTASSETHSLNQPC